MCTTTEFLDPYVLKKLTEVAAADPGYVLGFELDKVATERQGQLVFAIFERNGIMEISRTLISEAEL